MLVHQNCVVLLLSQFCLCAEITMSVLAYCVHIRSYSYSCGVHYMTLAGHPLLLSPLHNSSGVLAVPPSVSFTNS